MRENGVEFFIQTVVSTPQLLMIASIHLFAITLYFFAVELCLGAEVDQSEYLT